jgi:PleD family two-component response regulator
MTETDPQIQCSQWDADRAHRGRILFADDNADMRDYVRRLLPDQYDVETIAEGESALRAAREIS